MECTVVIRISVSVCIWKGEGAFEMGRLSERDEEEEKLGCVVNETCSSCVSSFFDRTYALLRLRI